MRAVAELLAVLKQGVRAALGRAGFALVRTAHDLRMEGALDRAARRAPEVRTIIDVGASNGMWTRKALARWPGARALLIEGNAVHADALRGLSAADPRVTTLLAVASAQKGTVYFDAHDPWGGSASAAPRAGDLEAPATTIDAAVEELGLPGPYLVKLDTHGHEGPILAGAQRTLAETSLAVIEAYNFQLSSECMLFHELCAFMAARGLRVIDLADPLLRPTDEALWQLDLVFVRDRHPSFESRSYRGPA